MRLLRQFSEAFSPWEENENALDFSDEAKFEKLKQPDELPQSPDDPVVSAIANPVQECVVLEPRSFEEIPQAVDALLAQKVLILKCAKMQSPSEAQRAVDFLAGAVYAIDGHQSRVWKDVFMFAPPSVRLTRSEAMVPIQPFALHSG